MHDDAAHVFGAIGGTPVNADLGRHVVIDSMQLPWDPVAPQVSAKILERVPSGADARETAILRIAPDFSIAIDDIADRLDILVLDGALVEGEVTHDAGSFLRVPTGQAVAFKSPRGAELLVKKRGGVPVRERLRIDTSDQANWEAWGGRGSDKAQLYDDVEVGEASWVGFMLPDLRIPSHDHAGGEEIFILDGVIEDETGVFGPGSWIRFPVGFFHEPFSHAQGCKMLVREGDARALAA